MASRGVDAAHAIGLLQPRPSLSQNEHAHFHDFTSLGTILLNGTPSAYHNGEQASSPQCLPAWVSDYDGTMRHSRLPPVAACALMADGRDYTCR